MLRTTAFKQDIPIAPHRPHKVSLSIWAILRYGAKPSEISEPNSIAITEGTEIHISNVHGSNLSLVSPVINFCCKATFKARKAFDEKHNIMPNAEKFTSPTVESPQPMATAHVGRSNHLSKSMPIKTTIATVKRHVVAPIISVKATVEKPSAMLFVAMEIEAAIAIGVIMKQNSDHVGTAIATPVLERPRKLINKQTMPPLTKWRIVTNLGNLNAYVTKTYFTASFMVESAVKYPITPITTLQPRLL
mmetsp:Transcript_85678/g.247395  ORF Transcript_85678/g.247395 Transcript_85678/m.247395 type:complete len:247 (+) Transcript_85678:440-1180(+)